MNLADLKKSLTERKFENCYIFTGDEIKIMNIYIQQISKLQNKEIIRKDNVGEIFKNLNQKLLTTEPKTYVILDDFDFTKQEKHWDKLLNGNSEHTIILIYSQLDKRGKFYKEYKDIICVFDKLGDDVLVKYIQKDVKMSEQNAKSLIQICENSYNRILMELDKLKHLMLIHSWNGDTAYAFMEQEGLIHHLKNEFVFSTADAICRRDKKSVLELLSQIDVTKDSPIAILSLVYTNIKAMMLVSICPKDVKPSTATGLNGWQIKNAIDKGNNYTPLELLQIMSKIKYIDESIKIGKIEPQFALPYLVSTIM